MDTSILKKIGNTPLIKIKKLTKELKNVEIYAKAEWFNPGGSVKDRAVLWMIEDAEKKGILTKDKTIIEPTSGNTGVAIALIGKLKGYKVKLVVPENVCEAKSRKMKEFGAEIIFTEASLGTDGSIIEANRIIKEDSERYFMPNQFDNPANPLAHYEGTGREIIEQTEGRITYFVAGIGTSGTIMGAGKRLKEYNNDRIKIIGVEPDKPLPGIEGLKHMATAIVPKVYDENFLDGKISVSFDEAFEMMRRLAVEEKIFVGHSSGAAMSASLKLAKEIKEGTIVTIFADSYNICDKFVSLR